MIRTLGIALSFVASGIAQQPPPSLQPQAPFAGVFVADATDDGTVWVRGARYKLGVGEDAVRFQPLFGPRAARDYPIRFGLLGCAVGGTELPLAKAGIWRAADDSFTRDRGALHECWTVAPQSAQQWFRFDDSPGSGALVLRIGAASDLVVVDDGPGVRFVAPGLGDVRYSDAVAIDASGRRLEIPIVLHENALTITVPAAFVAQASWPLIVDPIVTTLAVDTAVSNIQDPRVACEPTTGNWLVAAEEHLSATDVDIITWRYSNAITPLLLDTTWADNTTDFTHNPDVGFVAQTQSFVVAWHNATNPVNGAFDYRRRAATSTTQGTKLQTSAGIGGDLDNRPAIGSTRSGDRFLLVMFRKNPTGTDILAQLLASGGTNFATVFVGPLASAALSVVPGDVSIAASLTDKWVVVWRECTDAACGAQRVRMQAIVSNNGFSPLTREAALDLETVGFADHVSIGGHGGKLLAAWRAFDTTTSSNDIHGVPIAITGGTFQPQGTVQNLSAQEPGVNSLREHFWPSVSYDGVRFVYGYLEDDGTDLLFPHAATVHVSGSTITWHEGHLPLSVVPGRSCRTFDIAHGGTGAVFGHHFAVWQQDSPTFTGDVHGALVDARVPGDVTSLEQTGCGAPGEPTIGITGTPALGRTFTIIVSAPAGTPLVMAGVPLTSTLPFCGTCKAGIDIATLQLFGQASLAVAVPATPSLLTATVAFQGLSAFQAGGCPASWLGTDFALTDTLLVRVL